MQPVLTIFCPFTREWAVDRWLKNLANVEHDPSLTNLCIIVDGNQPLIATTINKFAKAHGYRSLQMKVNENWYPNEVKLAIRRMRVADVHNQSKDLINLTDSDIIIGLEDDTVFDRLKNFNQLYQPLLDDPNIGFVQGVQMGRWGANIIGAWRRAGETRVETCLPIEPPTLEDIDAGGFYGYATTRNLYLNHEYYTSSSQPWGPDVNYGFWLRDKGYRCLIDWGLVFGHADHSEIAYPDDPKYNKLVKVQFDKDLTTGKWERTDYEQTRY